MGGWPLERNLLRFPVIISAAPRATPMNLEDLYCDVDDFCRLFLPAWHRQLLTGGTRQRKRTSRLTLGEIMTILIYSHLIGKNPRLQAGETSVLSAGFDAVISLRHKPV